MLGEERVRRGGRRHGLLDALPQARRRLPRIQREPVGDGALGGDRGGPVPAADDARVEVDRMLEGVVGRRRVAVELGLEPAQRLRHGGRRVDGVEPEGARPRRVGRRAADVDVAPQHADLRHRDVVRVRLRDARTRRRAAPTARTAARRCPCTPPRPRTAGGPARAAPRRGAAARARRRPWRPAPPSCRPRRGRRASPRGARARTAGSSTATPRRAAPRRRAR